ncbi:MAG: hypothetical protein AMXMBFR8_26890 [Nevskiales bacterium]
MFDRSDFHDTDRNAKATWDRDPALRQEFGGDQDRYVWYCRAKQAGVTNGGETARHVDAGTRTSQAAAALYERTRNAAHQGGDDDAEPPRQKWVWSGGTYAGRDEGQR